jgi:hypothetical protein
MGIHLREVALGADLRGTVTGQVVAWNGTSNEWDVSAASVVPGSEGVSVLDYLTPARTLVQAHHALGFKISGGQQAWGSASDPSAADVSIEVEAGCGGTDCQLDGVRFQASKSTDAVTQPGTTTRFLFGYNSFFGSNQLAKGANAAKATSIDNLTNATLGSNTSVTIGSTGDPILGTWFNVYTANLGSGISANSFFELDFAFPEIVDLAHYQVTGAVTGPLAANGGLVFTTYLHDVGFVRLRATNVTGSNIGAVAGSYYVTVVRVS